MVSLWRSLIAVEYLHFIFGVVLQLHDAAIGRIEEDFQFVSMVNVVTMNAGAGLLLNRPREFVFCKSGEVVIQQFGAVLLQTCVKCLPCRCVIVQDFLASQVFNVSWPSRRSKFHAG